MSDAGTESRDPGGLARYLPIVTWLSNYDRSWLRNDVIAGLSVWALMVPTSLGYATISGVPVQYGLYAAMAGLIAFAVFSTSKQVTEGPSSSTAAVLGAGVLSLASAGSDEAVAVAQLTAELVTGPMVAAELTARPALIGEAKAAAGFMAESFGQAYFANEQLIGAGLITETTAGPSLVAEQTETAQFTTEVSGTPGLITESTERCPR